MSEKQKIEALVNNAMQGGIELEEAKKWITEIRNNSNITHKDLYKIIEKGYETTINETLKKGVITKLQEDAILDLINWVELSEKDVYKNERYMRFIKSCVIRELLEGKIPNRINPAGLMPINLQKNEILVWLFNPCQFYQSETTYKRKGNYSGVSLRIMRGVYYRTGGFTSEPVRIEQLTRIATGLLAVTNKFIHFYSSQKAFRIPLQKILAFTPHKDGITVHKDSSEKPFVFQTNDGWFTYNLLINLTQIE